MFAPGGAEKDVVASDGRPLLFKRDDEVSFHADPPPVTLTVAGGEGAGGKNSPNEKEIVSECGMYVLFVVTETETFIVEINCE